MVGHIGDIIALVCLGLCIPLMLWLYIVFMEREFKELEIRKMKTKEECKHKWVWEYSRAGANRRYCIFCNKDYDKEVKEK